MVAVPVRHGLETVDILRLRGACGAVLYTRALPRAEVRPGTPADAGDTLAFLVPPGTSEAWCSPGSCCTPGRGRPILGSRVSWLVPPPHEGRPAFTDPVALLAALGEASRTLAASDGRVAHRLR